VTMYKSGPPQGEGREGREELERLHRTPLDSMKLGTPIPGLHFGSGAVTSPASSISLSDPPTC
jgi:hypothetical protein